MRAGKTAQHRLKSCWQTPHNGFLILFQSIYLCVICRASYDVLPIALHEGLPGHHLQVNRWKPNMCKYWYFNTHFVPNNCNLTLSSLNLPLSPSSTTSRELLSQFSTCSGWRWLELGGKWTKYIVIIWKNPRKFSFKNGKLSHSSEMQNDALMHHDGLKG